MNRRARLYAVLAIVLGGAIGIISSTQPWLEVTLTEGAHAVLSVPGASALPLLAPLSLAALALGLALSIVGLILRYAFGVIAVAIGVVSLTATWRIAIDRPLEAIASTVTDTTGLTGSEAVTSLVQSTTVTAWPWAALAGWLLVAAGGVLTLVTARSWQRGGRRYRTAEAADTDASPTRPHDAIDSWDDLSRGADPTA